MYLYSHRSGSNIVLFKKTSTRLPALVIMNASDDMKETFLLVLIVKEFQV